MIEYITNKEPILKKDLKDIEESERQNYFWTVKAQSLEVTKQIQNKLIKSLENGESLYGFKISLDDDDLYDEYDRSYWDNAYNMNVALAQSRGNWEQMQELKEDGAEYAKFSAITDGKQTPQCNSLHGKVMKIDEWGKLGLVPPIHYGCRSTLIQLLDEEVVDSKGKYRPNIKTLDLEQRKQAIKRVQSGFGKVDQKSIEKYVAEKQDKVYNINKKLNEIIKKKTSIKTTLNNTIKFTVLTNEDINKQLNLGEKEYNTIYADKLDGTVDRSTGYIRTQNSRTINEALRTNNYTNLSEANKKVVSTLDNVISRTKLHKDTKLYRFVDKPFLGFLDEKYSKYSEWGNNDINIIVNRNDQNKKNILVNEFKSLIGKTFEDKGFVSTSYDKQKNYFKSEYDIMLEVFVPKGSNMYLTTNFEESEVILERNSKFEILDVIIEKVKIRDVEETRSGLEEDTYENKLILKVLKIK